MDKSGIKRRAVTLYRTGFVICLIATILATLAARNGNWILWGVNCLIFLFAGGCVLKNLQIARTNT